MCARVANRVLRVLSDLLGHENQEVFIWQLWVKENVERKNKDKKQDKKGRNRRDFWFASPVGPTRSKVA